MDSVGLNKFSFNNRIANLTERKDSILRFLIKPSSCDIYNCASINKSTWWLDLFHKWLSVEIELLSWALRINSLNILYQSLIISRTWNVVIHCGNWYFFSNFYIHRASHAQNIRIVINIISWYVRRSSWNVCVDFLPFLNGLNIFNRGFKQIFRDLKLIIIIIFTPITCKHRSFIKNLCLLSSEFYKYISAWIWSVESLSVYLYLSWSSKRAW